MAHTKARSRAPMLEEASDDDEYVLVERKQKKRGPKKAKEKHTNTTIHDGPEGEVDTPDLIQLLQATAAAVSEIREREKVAEFLQENGIHDDEQSIETIRSFCDIIAGLLPKSKSFGDITTGTLPSTMDLYDNSFVHRASSNIVYLLKPVEVFKGKKNFNMKKVFGYVRASGSTFPLMCALPGWVTCMETHPRLLKAELWTDVVKKFARMHNHDFKVSPFDRYYDRDDGDTYATHVEPRLMLWFALDILKKVTGNTQDPLTCLGDLWELRDALKEEIHADLVLSKAPCKECVRIKEKLERYTRIKFHFHLSKNLGEVKELKNKQRQAYLPRFVYQSEDSEAESDSESDIEFSVSKTTNQQVKKSTMQVVIRQKSSALSNTSKPARDIPLPVTSQRSPASSLVAKTKKRRSLGESDSEDETYTLPKQRTKQPVLRNGGSIYGIGTPDSSTFSRSAGEQAEKLLSKKRQQLNQASPVPSKKRVMKY